MSENVVIELENVTFGFGSVMVLEDISLKIMQNELISIVGPNGGGKSTFLKILLGLHHPDRGNVRVLGSSPVKARKRIGYMPQSSQFDPQFPVTVLDIVLMGRLSRSWRYTRLDKAKALSALTELDLADVALRQFSDLSGGQRQRVLIARALVSDPEILMMDEPTTNIDAVAEENFYRIIKTLNTRMTILMVSHDLGFVSEYVKKVICINRRAVIHPTHEVTGDVLKQIYGGEMRMVRHDHDIGLKE